MNIGIKFQQSGIILLSTYFKNYSFLIRYYRDINIRQSWLSGFNNIRFMDFIDYKNNFSVSEIFIIFIFLSEWDLYYVYFLSEWDLYYIYISQWMRSLLCLLSQWVRTLLYIYFSVNEIFIITIFSVNEIFIILISLS